MMSEIESYCDSDEEVFFGPVTEKERKIAENLRRRAMINQGLRSPTSEEKCSDSQDGEEGLHTLAMAAQMLSLSSGDSVSCQEEVTDSEVEKCQPSVCSTVLPPVETITRGKSMHTNDGSHLELDAVKFLSRHLPEPNHSGFFNGSPEDSKNSFYNSSNVHITSSDSLMDNGSDVLSYWNTTNPTNIVDFQQFQNETDQCLVVSTNDLGPSEVDVDYQSVKVEAADSCLQNGLTDSKVTCMNWDDVNEISKGEFGIKLSDNEEDMEKVERNLKVEEIIKFLADDEDKSEVEFMKESEEKEKQTELSITASNQPTFSSYDNVNMCVDSSDQILNEINHNHPEPKSECESKDVLGCCDFAPVNLKIEISPVKVKLEEAESLNGMVTEVPTPSDNMKKPPAGSSLKKPSSTYKRVPTPKYTPGMEKRPATPRPSRTPNSCTSLGKYQGTPRPLMPLQSPSMDTTTSKPCARSLLQENTPRLEGGTPFKTPNAKVKPATGSKIPHLQGAVSPSLNKIKRFAGIVSPVSQYIHSKPVTLIVNKKPSAVPIPVAHDRKGDTENKPPKTTDCVTPKLQSLPDMLDARDVENVDATNHSTLPEVNFKSALPVKIFSPIATSKTPKSGKTAIVTKHLGHVKIPSSEGGRVPLSFECKESAMPRGEVSLLLSKEVELHSPQLLRN